MTEPEKAALQAWKEARAEGSPTAEGHRSEGSGKKRSADDAGLDLTSRTSSPSRRVTPPQEGREEYVVTQEDLLGRLAEPGRRLEDVAEAEGGDEAVAFEYYC